MKNNSTPNSTERSPSSTGQPRQRTRQRRRNRNRFQRAQNVQKITGAGSVVFRQKGRVSEIFFVKNAYGRWTFPKGKQSPGEPLVETAIRETKEEAGLTGLRFIAPLGRTTFRYQREGQVMEKNVHFFLFEAPPDAKEHMTGVEGGMWEAAWVPAQKAFATSGYRNLDRLLAKAVRIISYEDQKRKGGMMRPNLRARL